MSSSLAQSIHCIRDILRTEGITNEDSINYSITFLLCRYLDKKLCYRLGIPEKYTYHNLLELEENALYGTFFTPGNKDCLLYYFSSLLDLKFLKDFKVKSVENLYKIIHLLRSLDIKSLQERYDLVGTIYEYHLKSGSSDPRDLGQYFTSRPVIDFMVKLVKPEKGEIICDPTMGTGGFLTMVVRYLGEKEVENIRGYDISEKIVNLASLNLLLETGYKFPKLYCRNILYQGIEKAEVILSNIPMGLKNIDYSSCCSTIQELGIKGNGESLFLQLYVNSLTSSGRAAIIVSLGFLFSKSHLQTRKYIVETCRIKKIITLGDIFLNTGAKTAILYLEKGKRTSQVHFSHLEEEEKTLSSLSIEEIVENNYSFYYKDYSNTEITDKYPSVTLKEICHFLPKSKRPASFGKEEGKYPFFTSSNRAKKCDVADYKEECLIIGNGGSANVKISDCFSCSDHNFILQSKVPEISNSYLYIYLSQNLHVLQAGFHGTGLENISKSYIEKLEIPLLPSSVRQELEEAERRTKKLQEKLERETKAFQSISKRYFGNTVSSPSPSPSRKISLLKRLNGLEEGKVLDVSNMDKEGRNTRIIKTPGSRSLKRRHEDLPIVSSNRESYLLALNLLKEENVDYMHCMEVWDE